MKPDNVIYTVFADIVGNKSYDKFLNFDGITYLNSSGEGISILDTYKECYSNIIEQHMNDLETLARLEEVITQIRCIEIAKKYFKLSQVKGYIYARTPFYRYGKDIKDIRVVVGKTEIYGENLDELLLNPEFVKEAKHKLLFAMATEIDANIIRIEKIIQNKNILEQYQSSKSDIDPKDVFIKTLKCNTN